MLQDATSNGAGFDSVERAPAPICLDGTFEDVTDKFSEWVLDSNEHQIFWVHGHAGAGKTALAQSIAERCAVNQWLAASFFFSRDVADRRTMKHFLPTIAYQLLDTVPSARAALRKAVKKRPSIFTQSFHDQLRALIINPLRSVPKQDLTDMMMVVVVDALDECGDQDSVQEAVLLIAKALQGARFPLRFFFTSRPEAHIRAIFEDPEVFPITRSLALEEFDPQANVRIFLEHGFRNIYRKHRRLMGGVRQPWPSKDDLDRLVRNSSGLFTYASTLLNFIDNDQEDPSRRLDAILGVERGSVRLQFAGLDRLYKQILSLSSFTGNTRLVVGTIILLFDPLPLEEIENLLHLERGMSWVALRGLNFIFIIPNEHRKPVRAFHASLHDFLTSPDRSAEYYINPRTHHAKITCHCFDLMARGLWRDVGNIENPLDADGSMRKRPCGREAVSGALRYACRYWAEHLSLVEFDEEILENLRTFGFTKILYWVEALSIIGELKSAGPSLRLVEQWLKVGHHCLCCF